MEFKNIFVMELKILLYIIFFGELLTNVCNPINDTHHIGRFGCVTAQNSIYNEVLSNILDKKCSKLVNIQLNQKNLINFIAKINILHYKYFKNFIIINL